MRHKFVTRATALSAAFGFTFAACAADIKLGVAEALTGPAAKYGVSIRNGFALAVEQINAKGGINGSNLVLAIEDEQGKKDEAITAFKKLIFQEKVLALFGPTLSNSAFAADPVANAAKIVVFGTSNTAEGITATGPFTFRNSVMEPDVVPVTVRAAARHFGIKKAAVIYGNDDALTMNGFNVFKTTLAAQGIAVVDTEAYAKGDLDFKAQLTKIKAANPDAIVCSCLVEEAANIMLQSRALGMKQPYIGGNGLNAPKLFEIAKEAGDNTVIGSPWYAESSAAPNQNFIAAYKAKYHADPDQFVAQAYDAMFIMAEALKSIKLSGNLQQDRVRVRDALPSVTLEGATGKFAFRRAPPKNGKESGYDADQEAIVNIAEHGKFVLLK